MTKTITVTAEQRDVLYAQVFTRLPGIDSVWHAAVAGDYDAADRLAGEYSDSLRLVVDDLRWGEGPGGSIELTTPPDVLRRAVERLRDLAARQGADQARERAELREDERQNGLLIQTCEQILVAIEG